MTADKKKTRDLLLHLLYFDLPEIRRAAQDVDDSARDLTCKTICNVADGDRDYVDALAARLRSLAARAARIADKLERVELIDG